MSKEELCDRYEHDIDKIALTRVKTGKRLHYEGALALEAAFVTQRYDQLPTLAEAKEVVVRDVALAMQQIQEAQLSPQQEITPVEDDEETQPF